MPPEEKKWVSCQIYRCYIIFSKIWEITRPTFNLTIPTNILLSISSLIFGIFVFPMYLWTLTLFVLFYDPYMLCDCAGCGRYFFLWKTLSAVVLLNYNFPKCFFFLLIHFKFSTGLHLLSEQMFVHMAKQFSGVCSLALYPITFVFESENLYFYWNATRNVWNQSAQRKKSSWIEIVWFSQKKWKYLN